MTIYFPTKWSSVFGFSKLFNGSVYSYAIIILFWLGGFIICSSIYKASPSSLLLFIFSYFLLALNLPCNLKITLSNSKKKKQIPTDNLIGIALNILTLEKLTFGYCFPIQKHNLCFLLIRSYFMAFNKLFLFFI